MMPEVLGRAFVDGAWIRPTGPAVQVVNPATGELVGTVRDCSPAEVDRAVVAAESASADWAATPLAARMDLVRALADGLAARRDELATAMSTEMGAPISAARNQMVNMALNDIAGFLDAAGSLHFSEQVGNALVVNEPVGVVAAITPWNAPLHQMALKVAPALIAGCTVVLKPSEVTPTCAEIFVDIAARNGAPPGVLNLVTGAGSTVGQELVTHPRVRMVSFTGSVAVGKRVAELATSKVKRVTLELGGKSACVVLDDADLAAAVTQTVGACFRNSGQVCVAMTRLLVPRERLAEAEKLAADAASRWVPGDPADEQTVLGPLASAAQHERVMGYLRKGVAEGARVVYGGPDAPTGMQSGCFVAPTVFSDVTVDMTIAQEEIFGPVMCLIGYRDEADAVRIANGTRYGLAGAVWSGDQQRAYRVAGALQAGVVRINGGGEELGTPFGGYQESGLGREGGRYGIEEFLELKTISAPPGFAASTRHG